MRHRTLHFEVFEAKQMLTQIVVNTLEDVVNPNDAWVSLREAIAQANETTELDEIHFAPSLNGGTLKLTSGELVMQQFSPVKIIGPGARLLTIDASPSDPTPNQDQGDGSRHFNALNGEIQGLTLTGGDAGGYPGGGSIVAGDLIVRDMIFRGNYSAEEAGAIRAFGQLEVYDSWFDGNSAFDDGGAIYTFGPLHVENSAFTNNFTDGWRGADGGAIAARSRYGEMVISNSTFSGNQIRRFGGGGGAIDYGGTVVGRIIHSTIVNNSSPSSPGVHVHNGTFEIYNTVMAQNVGGADGDLVLRTSTTLRSSLIGNAGTLPFQDFQKVLFGRPGNPLDPMLSPLIDDGQLLPYHRPLPGSPLVDSGQNDGFEQVAYDQRGTPYWRLFGQPDIGAIESNRTSDLNRNDVADIGDIDMLCLAIRFHSTDSFFDLDSNDIVDLADLDWLTQNWRTTAGDANVDRAFDTADLVSVFSAAEYESDFPNSKWSTGDWNCDGRFDSSDLILAFKAGSFEVKSPEGASVNWEVASALAHLYSSDDKVTKPYAAISLD